MNKEFTDKYGVVYEDASCQVIRSAPKDLKEYVLPDTVRTIQYAAFEDCTRLEKLVLNEGLEELCDASLRNCSSLKSLTLPSTLHGMRLWSMPLAGTRICELTVKTDQLVCDGKALYNKDKTGLLFVLAGTKDYTVPATVKEVSDDALSSCHLKRLAFEEGTECINCFNLSDMKSLKEIIIPKSAEYYSTDPWRGCDPMMGRPDIVTFLGKKLVRKGNCIYSEDMKELRYVDNDFHGKPLIVPASVEKCRFAFFRNQISEVRFSKGCKRISGWHLDGMNTMDHDDGSLTTIVLPGTIEEVDENIFEDYFGIEHVYVPDDKVDYFRELLPEHLAKHVEPYSEKPKKTQKKAPWEPTVPAKDLYPLIVKKVIEKGDEGFFAAEEEYVTFCEHEIQGVVWENGPHGGKKTVRVHLLYDDYCSDDEPEQVITPLSQVSSDMVKAIWEWIKDKD